MVKKEAKQEKTKQQNKPKSASALRKKKKRWYGIMAPKEFNNKKIGDTLAGEPKEMVGRSVIINLMNLVDDYKKQGINIKFKIESINDDNAMCKTVGYEMLRSHARRVVRKNADKTDDSFLAESKDGMKFRIKPLIVTRTRVSHATLGKLRKIAKDYLNERFKELNMVEVFESAIQSKFQREIRSNLIKICPIGACEIRQLEILGQ